MKNCVNWDIPWKITLDMMIKFIAKIIRFQGDCNKYCNGIPGLKSNQIFLSLEDWYRLQNSVGNSDD